MRLGPIFVKVTASEGLLVFVDTKVRVATGLDVSVGIAVGCKVLVGVEAGNRRG
jgi:hypothetical protein